jgi:hypothetical protein
MGWAHGGVEALPRLQPTAKIRWSSSGGEEISVLADLDSVLEWMRGKNEVQRRNDGKSIVVPILDIPIQVTAI